MAERSKYHLYRGHRVQSYFWRTYDQQEIDLVEDSGGKLAAYETKWSPRKTSAPAAWVKAYPDSEFSVIDRTRYLDFIV